MTEKDELIKLRGSHKVYMRRVDSLETEIINLLNDFNIESEDQKEKLFAYKTKYQSKIDEIKTLDNKILNVLKNDEYEFELNESLLREDKFIDILTKVDRTLTKIYNKELKSSEASTDRESNVSATHINPNKNIKVKLPKLELKPFDGNILNWQPFWDRFHSAIDSNPSISPVDKFNYLYSFLTTAASECISGLTPTAENYPEAVNLLKQRYGNTQILINAHMQQFVSLPCIKSMNDIKNLRKLYEKIEGSVRNLKTLKVDPSSYGNLLVPLINAKLPNELRLIISRKFENEVWKLSELLNYLKFEIEAKERSVSLGNFQSDIVDEQKFDDKYSTYSFHAGSSEKRKSKHCVFCESRNHPSWKCFNITDPKHKRNILKRNGLCFICFEKGHLSTSCSLKDYSCRKCKQKHNISICFETKNSSGNNNPGSKVQQDNPERTITNPVDDTSTNFNSFHTENNKSSLLQTAKTKASDLNDLLNLNIRVFFDSGSQKSYISEEVRKKLKLKTIRTEELYLKTFSNENPTLHRLNVVKIKLISSKKSFIIEVLVIPNICCPLTNQRVSSVAQSYPHLRNIKLADSFDEELMKIDVLVGTDYYHRFFTDEIIRGKTDDEPVALNTYFGWVLSGCYKINKKERKKNTHTFFVETIPNYSENFNDDMFMKNCFSNVFADEIDEISHDESVYSLYKENLKFDGNKYEVKLPFKKHTEFLPDNYKLAKSRLFGLKKQLNFDPELRATYDDIIKGYLKENIIEEVKDNDLFENIHYLAHRSVVRKERDTTKVRVVFDASAKLPNKPSLNDILYSGPCLLPLVQDILFRFRLGEIAVVADIQQAFLQISIEESHRNFLRFLWFENINTSNEIKILRFARVVFGLTCSPFLLNATIKTHVQKYINDENLSLLTQFLRDLYVDDTATSFDEISAATQFFELSKRVLSAGGFNLRKWDTNNLQLRQIMNSENSLSEHSNSDESTYAQSELGFNTPKYRKVLGIQWDISKDLLVYDFTSIADFALRLKFTKRNILRVSAMFYDPLGITSPISLQAKLLFKSLCAENLPWDDPIPLHYAVQWRKFLDNLLKLQALSVDRHLFSNLVDERNIIELHGFCDSSSVAYSAVIYVREISNSKKISTKLYSAKCRLAPSKMLSIPRLELLACLLLSEHIKAVYDAISTHIVVNNIFCYSDSMIALWWIKQIHKSWKIWVENRVEKIRTNVPINCWRYIRTNQNPADIGTRQVTPCGLFENSLWWEGPSVLKSEDSNGPVAPCDFEKENIFELKDNESFYENLLLEGVELEEPKIDKGSVLMNSVESKVGIGSAIEIERFRELEKLLKVTSFVVRFVNNLKASVGKGKIRKGEIVVDELIASEKLWVKYEQSKLKNDTRFKKLQNSLDLFFDEENLIRSKTRIDKHLKFSFETKNPLMLQSNSYFTKLAIVRSHDKVFHCGLEATLSNLRLKYWITKGRQTVKNVLKSCFLCKLVKGKFITPVKTPSLPTFRVNCLYAFESVGVDFAGPLLVKDVYSNSGKLHKCYLLLFTCATTRSLHLEITRAVSAEEVIFAVRRFIARRGTPHLFISDNFKSFKAKEVKDFLRKNRIKWSFILEKSPWWGGFYKRLIAIVKSSLKKVIGKAILDFCEMFTIITEIEACLNSRPLTYLNEDNSDDLLTPNHLMYGRNIYNHHNLIDDIIDVDSNDKRKQVFHCRFVINHFLKRFMNDYLLALQEPHSYQRYQTKDTCCLREGDIVLIKDATLPRLSWLKGKVEKLKQSYDNLVPAADVRVYQPKYKKTICIKRPIQHFVHLELSNVSEDNESDGTEKINQEPAMNFISNQRPRRLAALNADILLKFRS